MIEVKKLVKSYGNRNMPVLKGIDMQVEKGKIHGLIGPNGSGKTTLIKCLTGIYPADSGEILFQGEPVYDNPAVKEKIGYVADSNQFFVGYRVKQLVEFYHGIYPKFLKEDFEALNQIFQVDLNKRIRQLSKGQQMRVSFMLAMASNPEIMILDEPTSGLDAIAKKEILDLIVQAVEQREMTIVISSHHLSELERICDTMTMLNNGVAELNDELENVKNQICKYQVVFPDGAPHELYELEDLLTLSNVGNIYTVILRTGGNFPERAKQMGAIYTEEMQVNLEEMFIQTAKGGVGYGQ